MNLHSTKLPISMGLLSAGLIFSTACTSDAEETEIPNNAPVAAAGDDVIADASARIELDGSASYDADGDTLKFNWSFDHLPEGSMLDQMELPFAKNNSADAMKTSFAPDVVGTYIVGLVVSDGQADSSMDYVIVTAEVPEDRPVAMAGDDVVVASGTAVSLDGTDSYDPEGRALTWSWSFIQVAPGSSLDNSIFTQNGTAEGATAEFTPDIQGVYAVNLVVNNGLADSSPDSVMVTATGDTNVPTSNAGEDIEAEDCTNIQLDGSLSADPDGDQLTYFWELQSKPATSSCTSDCISDRSAATPTLWADVAGVYTLSLAVYDGSAWSNPDEIVITAAERTANTPPTIVIPTLATIAAGEVECAVEGYGYACDECEEQMVTLGDGATVTDDDGDPYTLNWEITSGNAAISSPDELETLVTLQNVEAEEPEACLSNEFIFELTATDCTGESSTASTTITADCCGITATTP